MVRDHTNTYFAACMFLAICLLILFVVVTYVIQENGERRNGEGAKKAQTEQADWVVNQIKYVRDKRTSLCFAYAILNDTNGISSLSITEVSCNKIRDLLPDNQK